MAVDRSLARALAEHPEVGLLLPVIEGWPDRVALVGGAVRDLLLGALHVDVDLVVEGDGIALARALAARLEGSVVAHDAFGTAIVEGASGTLDVASARVESYAAPGVLPAIAPATLEGDLARRDFSVNAMAAPLRPDERGVLIDPFGGRDDLLARRLRVLHDRSFLDDPTRIVRAVRYEARLGFAMDAATEALARAAAPSLAGVSAERVRDALALLLLEDRAGAALARLEDLGALAPLGLTGDEDRVAAADALAATRAPDADRALVRLAVSLREPAAVVADRLRLRRADASRLSGEGAEALIARAVLDPASAPAILRHLDVDRHLALAVDGGDVMRELGIGPSPRVGAVLAELLELKRRGGLADREAELRALRALADPRSDGA